MFWDNYELENEGGVGVQGRSLMRFQMVTGQIKSKRKILDKKSVRLRYANRVYVNNEDSRAQCIAPNVDYNFYLRISRTNIQSSMNF